MKIFARYVDGNPVEFLETDLKAEDLFPPEMDWRDVTGISPLPELVPQQVQAPPPPLASIISRRQGRLALIGVDKLVEMETWLEGISDPIEKLKARVEYEADTWEKHNPFLQTVWEILGGTVEELDDLFETASKL